MSDSLMSRDHTAMFLLSMCKTSRRMYWLKNMKRLKMAELYEKERAGEKFIPTSEELLSIVFASDKYKESEIEWRHRELNAGAREY